MSQFDLRELQKCQMQILDEFDKVCKTNGLRYCLAYGTCLGAIRHGGFIPWDDDIDVKMPIEDFKKLENLASEFSNPFFLQTRNTDREYGLMIYRVRNSQTTLIEKEEKERDINHGIFIDIYPLFNSPQDNLKKKYVVINAMLYRLLLYGKPPVNHGKLMRVGAFILLKLIPKKFKSIIIEKTYKNLINQKYTGKRATLYGDDNVIFDEELLFPTRNVLFENKLMPVPANAEMYLKLVYGNYMEFPPIEKQRVHHNFEIVDINTSYKKYRGMSYCVK